jgi:dCMP deaminase
MGVENDHPYFMGIAMAVRKRANCLASRVGALVVVEGRVVSTGYNGTPQGLTNCLDNGCPRCARPDKFKPGTSYDICLCVHAEQNALLAAARFGITLQGGSVYTTLQPCFGCAKEMLQAGIKKVFYLHPWAHPDETLKDDYDKILRHFPEGIHPLSLEDPDAAWAFFNRPEK